MPIAVSSQALDFTLETTTSDGSSAVKYAEQLWASQDVPKFSAVKAARAQ